MNIPYLLDYSGYEIIEIAQKKGLPVILQRSKDEKPHYCVQYAGNGSYFASLSDARQRFKSIMERKTR